MANKYLDTKSFDEALIFAVKAHHDTERKGHKSPYILHVAEAACICETMTSDLDLLSAAVLHDVIEDTDTTLEEIREKFGDRVADLVNSETEVPVEGKTPSESWQERKQATIVRLKNACIEAKMVALGDKLSNMRAIARDYKTKGEGFWDIFHNSNPKDVKWYYTGLADALSDLKEYVAYQEFEKLVKDTFKNV